MLILGIETAQKTASVAVTNGSVLIAEKCINAGRTHSQILVPLIKEVLETAQISLSDLDGIAVDSGPGSYTGIRIGIATAKGLAFAQNIPTAGVSSLAAIGTELSKGLSGAVAAVKHARGNLCYAALFEDGERISPDSIISLDELKGFIPTDRPCTFVGDGAQLLLEACKNTFADFNAAVVEKDQSAYNICLTAQDFAPPENLRAAYLEITKAEKENQGLL